LPEHSWVKEFPGAVTVCDREGVILEMNDRAVETFKKDGGHALIGTNALDCHPEPARSKMMRLLETQESNVYTIEKNGIKKMIYQAPWYDKGEFGGLVELSLVIPAEMPHFIRK
jgi:transcriptional regulator with PAS, ATPase and Fis domain